MVALDASEAIQNTAPEAAEPEHPREDPRWVGWLLVLAALLPHAGAALPLLSYYYRDFSIAFYPLRHFNAVELAAGRWTFWNPYLYEGSFVLPAFYPLDLLHVVSPTPEFISWLLTLHFPLAALAAYCLGRELRLTRWGAFAVGAVYSLGGLALSTLNLYVYLQALATAPVVALAVRRAGLRGGRWIPVAAACLALSLSTFALEFVMQAALLGLALVWAAWSRPVVTLARVGLALALGVGLAGVPLMATLGLLQETPRAAGLNRYVALANAAHPLVLLQTLIPDLFGPVSRSIVQPTEEWWGRRFFTRGFPYFLTLYLGPQALALALAGVGAMPARLRRVLIALALLGAWYALGERGWLAPLIAGWPVIRWVRFPIKALLLPYVVVALLAGFGVDRLRSGKGWRIALATACASGALTILLAGTLWFARDAALTWAGVPSLLGARAARTILWSCTFTAASALVAVVAGALVLRGRAPAGRCVVLLVAVMVLELGRAGLGINPQVPSSFYAAPSHVAPEEATKAAGGRVFTYGVEFSPAFDAFARRGFADFGRWMFFLYRQTLTPYSGMLDRVEMALAIDFAAFLPRREDLSRADFDPRLVERILPRLRQAAVSRVLSLDPIQHPELRLSRALPVAATGLRLHVYELTNPWPRTYVACRVQRAADADEALAVSLAPEFATHAVALELAARADCDRSSARRREAVPGHEVYEVEADGNGYLVTRDSYARGWRATLDGHPVSVLRANGKHRAVRVEAGRHDVVFHYEAPGLRLGLGLFLSAAAVAALLCLRPILEPASAAQPR